MQVQGRQELRRGPFHSCVAWRFASCKGAELSQSFCTTETACSPLTYYQSEPHESGLRRRCPYVAAGAPSALSAPAPASPSPVPQTVTSMLTRVQRVSPGVRLEHLQILPRQAAHPEQSCPHLGMLSVLLPNPSLSFQSPEMRTPKHHTHPPSLPHCSLPQVHGAPQPRTAFPPTQDSPSPKAHLPPTQVTRRLETGIQQPPGGQDCMAGEERAKGLPYWFTWPDLPRLPLPNSPDIFGLLGA